MVARVCLLAISLRVTNVEGLVRSALCRRIYLAASVILAACTAAESTQESRGTVERVFTPTQYSVEDFYKNSEFFGGSWSPDRQKLLVSSNMSGIWNAYAIPAAGGQP